MTTTNAAPSERKMRPKTRGQVGRPFAPGNPGKKRGTLATRTIVGMEVARALSGKAADRLAALVDSRSPRVAFEASRLVLAYAWGAPRQTLELSGGFADLARELAAALAAARERRAALDAVAPVAALVAAPEGIPEASGEPESEGVP